MRVADVVRREVVCISGQLSLREAARVMRARHVGALVVVESVEGERCPVGMLTDRDIVVAVVAAAIEADSLTAADVMSRDPITCDIDQSVFEAIELMRLRGVRRLPVLNAAGGVAGLLAADDVLTALVGQLQALTDALRAEHRNERAARN